MRARLLRSLLVLCLFAPLACQQPPAPGAVPAATENKALTELTRRHEAVMRRRAALKDSPVKGLAEMAQQELDEPLTLQSNGLTEARKAFELVALLTASQSNADDLADAKERGQAKLAVVQQLLFRNEEVAARLEAQAKAEGKGKEPSPPAPEEKAADEAP